MPVLIGNVKDLPANFGGNLGANPRVAGKERLVDARRPNVGDVADSILFDPLHPCPDGAKQVVVNADAVPVDGLVAVFWVEL